MTETQTVDPRERRNRRGNPELPIMAYAQEIQEVAQQNDTPSS